MAAYHRESGMAIESVIFPDKHGEFSYTEEADRGDGLVRIQTMIIDGPNRCPEEWDAMVYAIVTLIDAARLALRDPPQQIPPRG